MQRLAEWSAEATKQIAAIVKTIQTDTQDAVSAMEQSTQGVGRREVVGCRRSGADRDRPGVAQPLDLIENISTSTQDQARSATDVAKLMQGILSVTEQTRPPAPNALRRLSRN